MSKRATMDIEMGLLNADTTSADGPKSYSQEVTEFRMFLDNTAKLVHKLKEATQEFNSATESAAMKEIKGRMEKDTDEVGKMAHIMKEKLRIMLLKNLDNMKNSGCEKDTAIDISSMALTIALKTRIKERKSDFQNLAETIRQEYLHVIQRRIFTVTGIKLSDEVIRVIDTGSVVQMFEKAVQGISAEQSPQMVAAVDEINEWRVAATDFDKKFLGVQKNFDQMAALVDAGEKLDKALNKKLCDERDKNERDLWDERDKNDRLLATVICLGLGLLFFCAYVIFVVAISG